MDMNKVASSNRIHIAFFGMRNAGKSSVVNAITAQQMSVVSEVMGTTTDPVRKSMEILPLGPVLIIDTPGVDDEGELGKIRVNRAKQVLDETDIAVLVVDAVRGLTSLDKDLLDTFHKKNLPYVIAYNKSDLLKEDIPLKDNEILVSAKESVHIWELKEMIGKLSGVNKAEKKLVSDLVKEKDVVILVIPVDEAAPKGRLIMPQQMVIRELLDAHCSVVCCQPEELGDAIENLRKEPKLVITDSQAFEMVADIVPKHIFLTSFSILMARYKGELEVLLAGVKSLDSLKDGDNVLISEACSHHRQCNDIGTVKLPGWIMKYTKVKPEFSFTSGGDFPSDLTKYKLIVHCGGCMINEAAMKNRIKIAQEQGVLIVNYGMLIAKIHGILDRSLEPFVNMFKR
ncbi:MAG: [FeFe] hydrogenase H-cluster maturation GTPase HydF [Lachnospiraceae bacterium]